MKQKNTFKKDEKEYGWENDRSAIKCKVGRDMIKIHIG